jgi:hypothetical protein
MPDAPHKSKSKRGGARPNSGPKAKPKAPGIRDKSAAARILDALNRPAHSGDAYEIQRFRAIDNAGVSTSLDLRKYLYDKRDGKAVHTVNHLHDKPLEMNVTHSLSERFRIAMEKAEKRVSGR